MKAKIFFVIFSVMWLPIFSQVLVEKDGYQYTQENFNRSVKFVKFICGIQLTEEEKEALKQGEINDFNANPATALQNVAYVDEQMQQLYALEDVLQIGLARSVLIANLYSTIYQLPPDNAFKQIFNTHTVVLALDPYNNLSFTQKDLDAYFDYLTFNAALMGSHYGYNQETRAAYAQSIINQFLYGDYQTKSTLAMMKIYFEYVQTVYQKLPDDKKNDFTNSITNNYNELTKQNGNQAQSSQEQTSTNDWQTQQMYFNTMQDIMLQQHATSLNIIENIGGTGNYWEVVNDPW
jgi:hypothetical protein